MAVRLGLYMNARRVIEGTDDLNGNAVTNVEQLAGLRNAGRLGRVDVLIRMSRDLADHRRQSDDGLDSEIQPMWKGGTNRAAITIVRNLAAAMGDAGFINCTVDEKPAWPGVIVCAAGTRGSR